jgi:N-acetylmuramoyl-L-alanine amidase
MVGKHILFILFFICCVQIPSEIVQAQSKVLQNNEPATMVVKVKPGDGIFTLLRRYGLHTNSNNLDSFLFLNSLKPTDYLILKKDYKLPIKIYTYDGKSIRSTLGITDMEHAVRIKLFNDDLVKSGVKTKSYVDDKVLWVPYHELYGISEDEDFKAYSFDAPIMGAAYKEITVVDESLEGCVYYLVSGHGGPDPGAMTKKDGNYLCEDEYAYDVTLRLARNLLSHGAKVYIIIRDNNDGIRDKVYLGYDKDEVCWYKERIPANHKARLKQRVDVVNKLFLENADAKLQKMICIHVDSRSVGEKIDIFFYHFPGSTAGESSANLLLNTIRDKYNEHQKDRGYRGIVKGRDLYVLRESMPSAVYIELGNITNEFDQKRLLIVDNRQAIANWLGDGVIHDAMKNTK